MLSDGLTGNEALRAAVQEYERRLQAENFDLLEPFIDEHAVYWPNDGQFIGPREIRKTFEETWSSFKTESYTIDNVQWLVATATDAVCIYHFHWATVIDGIRHTYDGRGTNVFICSDGDWKLVHEHLSKLL